jgi:hypothetical protein
MPTAQRLDKLDKRPYRVLAANTVRRGYPVVLAGGFITEAAAVGTPAIGIALEAGNGNATLPHGNNDGVGHTISVAHFGSGCVAALVGTGGCTQGTAAGLAAALDGSTDVVVGGGVVARMVYGLWEETGVAGDLRQLNLAIAGLTVTA